MTKQRDYTIDLLKFIFALIIVCYHSKNLVATETGTYFIGGVISVDFFFLVSGYYLAKSAMAKNDYYGNSLGRDSAHFMWHKICGFQPNYIIALLIAFIVRHIWIAPLSGSAFRDFTQIWKEMFFLEMTGFGEGRYIVNNVTWYLSALLIVSFFLYPLMRKYKDTYFYILAPIIVVFLFGLMFKTFPNLKKPYSWTWGFVMKGVIRAFMEVAFGSLIYRLSEKARQTAHTKGIKIMGTILAVLLWAFAIWYMFGHPASKRDYDLVLIFAAALFLTASPFSYLNEIKITGIFQKIIPWLGAFSFSLYLGHGFWSQVFRKISNWDSFSYPKKLLIYAGLAIITGLFIMYSSKGLRYLWKTQRKKAVH